MPIQKQRILELALEKLREEKNTIDAEKARLDTEVRHVRDELAKLGRGAKRGRKKATTKKIARKAAKKKKTKKTRKRRKLSAKERKARSKRMKKYWAERKRAEATGT